jgi:hypothetical protein
MRDNAWFVGLAPRRNPEIAVVILWEGGMKGFYSARRAALVIEAYVNKQRLLANNIHEAAQPVLPPAPAAATPHKPNDTAQLEMGAVWNESSLTDKKMRGGHFSIGAGAKAPHLAEAFAGLKPGAPTNSGAPTSKSIADAAVAGNKGGR